jgi:hypothetical protein
MSQSGQDRVSAFELALLHLQTQYRPARFLKNKDLQIFLLQTLAFCLRELRCHQACQQESRRT